jgi:hypothetical protein
MGALQRSPSDRIGPGIRGILHSVVSFFRCWSGDQQQLWGILRSAPYFRSELILL